MTRILAALVLALGLTAPALAADHLVRLTLDGRPVDRNGGVALAHRGIVYADVVDLVKSFNGLLTFQGKAVVVSIGGRNATFTAGSRTVMVGDGALVMRGQAFMRNGDLYVPVDFFVKNLTGGKVTIDPAQTHANIAVSASPLS